MKIKKLLLLFIFGLLTASAVVVIHGCGSSASANFTLKGAIS